MVPGSTHSHLLLTFLNAEAALWTVLALLGQHFAKQTGTTLLF